MSKELRFPNVNSVTISGRVTRDPELNHVGQNGTPLLKLDIAFNRNFQKNGEWEKETGYVQVTVWGDHAEKMSEHLHKGSPVLVEAYLKMESWQDNDNNKRSKLALVANKVYNLEKDSDGYSEPIQEDDSI